jgi:hypothetical protein
MTEFKSNLYFLLSEKLKISTNEIYDTDLSKMFNSSFPNMMVNI